MKSLNLKIALYIILYILWFVEIVSKHYSYYKGKNRKLKAWITIKIKEIIIQGVETTIPRENKT